MKQKILGESVNEFGLPAEESINEATEGQLSAMVDVESVGHPEGVPANSQLAHDTKVTLKFTLTQDTRSYGIKSLVPVIPDQEISLKFVEQTEDEDVEHELKVMLKGIEHEFRAGSELGQGLSIAPSLLDIDFKTMKSKLVFWVS